MCASSAVLDRLRSDFASRQLGLGTILWVSAKVHYSPSPLQPQPIIAKVSVRVSVSVMIRVRVFL